MRKENVWNMLDCYMWEATEDCGFMHVINYGVWPISFKMNGLTLTRVIKGFFLVRKEEMLILLALTFYYNAKEQTETEQEKTNVL